MNTGSIAQIIWDDAEIRADFGKLAPERALYKYGLRILRQQGNTVVVERLSAVFLYVFAEYFYSACIRVDQPRYSIEQGRFSRAVCAENTENLTLCGGQRGVEKHIRLIF